MATELIPISYESEQPTVSGRELFERLNKCNSFKDFFVTVCEEKISRDYEDLKELDRVVKSRPFVSKYGSSAIVYLSDCITAEKLLPMNSMDAIQQIEREMKIEIVNNFSSFFPNLEFIDQEVNLKGIGRIDILAKKGDCFVIIELKSGHRNPNTQLIAYASYYDNPILVGITEEKLSTEQKLDFVQYFTLQEIRNRADAYVQ